MPASTGKRKREAEAGLRLATRLVRGTAVMFAAAGLVMLYGARDYIPPLGQPDPVVGLSTRALLCVAGLAHLAISGALCAARDPMTLGLLACWASLNYIVYLAGTIWLKAAGAIPAVVVLGWELGVSAKAIYTVWGVFIAYLALGGLLLVVLERRRRVRQEAEAFVKGWGEMRQASPPPSPGGRASPRAQTSSESSPSQGSRGPSPSQVGSTEKSLSADFKFSCPLCGQHIRCEGRYLGTEDRLPSLPEGNPCARHQSRRPVPDKS